MGVNALEKKLFAAFKEIDAVEKRGRNEKQSYNYVKATDVAREVRAALIKHGISFGSSTKSCEHWTQETKSGGTMLYVLVNVDFVFTDHETGESKTINGIGCGSDTGDKAIYKGLTGALKYALRLNFLIPDESDPENDRDEKAAPTGISEQSITECLDRIKSAGTMQELQSAWARAMVEAKIAKDQKAQAAYIEAKNKRKGQLETVVER